ncbi:hypothetical protein AAFC00_006010 [Neodothiora populina]|uniref:Shikimate dehydrogenase substrate binding N-terminal domain-containing protein n=1 Tax=Neodothiora populina TaxID=2781224 RepID=A0ABR3P7E4_9PEZI
MAIPEHIITCKTPDIHSVDRFGFLFGYPIAHSFSPLMHETVFKHIGYKWRQFFLESTNMSQFLELIHEPNFFGASVTMPHKVAIMKHLDEITDECEAIGACNTIFLKRLGDKRIYVGTNTDVIGIREAFTQNVSNPDEVYHGRPALVVGGGGAARSAVYALKKFLGVTTVYLVNREKAEVDVIIDWCKGHGYGDGLVHVATVEQAQSLEGPGGIVACVPDFPPLTESEIEARDIMQIFLNKQHKGAILEMCYHPKPWTQIAALSEQAGWQVILGTEAMIYQGFAQSQCWTGKALEELPLEEVKVVIAKELEKSPH